MQPSLVAVLSAMSDIKVHCQGQGPLVYLIGGGPAFTTWNLRPIQNKLSVRYKVCRWDMRGVGDNARLEMSSRVTALSQWIQDMYDILPQTPVVLWGHSWGALQILLFAKQYPERVSKLILSNPVDPALLSHEQTELKRYVHPETTHRLKLEDIGTPVEKLHSFRSKIASYFADVRQGWDYASGFTQSDSNSRLNVRIWEEYQDTLLMDADIRLLADKLAGLIHCQNDVLQPESLAEYTRLLDKSKHHVLTGCAHFPWEEVPDEYYRVLFSLIDE
ncbi:MAG: alpha/beta fold hydrolase [Gammaproteobacteria bacterium]|nr:alpha/beta fold hydrolase [Gammaproteobacteria bacterium]